MLANLNLKSSKLFYHSSHLWKYIRNKIPLSKNPKISIYVCISTNLILCSTFLAVISNKKPQVYKYCKLFVMPFTKCIILSKKLKYHNKSYQIKYCKFWNIMIINWKLIENDLYCWSDLIPWRILIGTVSRTNVKLYFTMSTISFTFFWDMWLFFSFI